MTKSIICPVYQYISYESITFNIAIYFEIIVFRHIFDISVKNLSTSFYEAYRK